MRKFAVEPRAAGTAGTRAAPAARVRRPADPGVWRCRPTMGRSRREVDRLVRPLVVRPNMGSEQDDEFSPLIELLFFYSRRENQERGGGRCQAIPAGLVILVFHQAADDQGRSRRDHHVGRQLGHVWVGKPVVASTFPVLRSGWISIRTMSSPETKGRSRSKVPVLRN